MVSPQINAIPHIPDHFCYDDKSQSTNPSPVMALAMLLRGGIIDVIMCGVGSVVFS
jgi:hypothetical protein